MHEVLCFNYDKILFRLSKSALNFNPVNSAAIVSNHPCDTWNVYCVYFAWMCFQFNFTKHKLYTNTKQKVLRYCVTPWGLSEIDRSQLAWVDCT